LGLGSGGRSRKFIASPGILVGKKKKKKKKVPRLIPVVENNLVLMQRNIIFAVFLATFVDPATDQPLFD
jgi:hypothetical protein